MRATALTLAAALALAGCSAGSEPRADAEASYLPVPAVSGDPTGREGSDNVPEVAAPVVEGPIPVKATEPEQAMPQQQVAPDRLTVTALGLDMPVKAVGIEDDGEMEIPTSASRAGWYRYGPGLTSDAGHVVIAAHVDDATGLGPFARLREASKGDRIVLDGPGGSRSYVVERVEQTDKQQVDLDAVFSRTGEPQLVLVTCGGSFDWDARHYSDNVIVWAVPEEASP